MVTLFSVIIASSTLPAEAGTWNVKVTGNGYHNDVPFTATGEFSFSGDDTVSGSGTGHVSYDWAGYDDSGYLWCNISGSSSTSYSVSGSTTSDGKLAYTLSGASPSTIPVTAGCGGAVLTNPNSYYPNPFNHGSMTIEKTWAWSENTNTYSGGWVKWRFDYDSQLGPRTISGESESDSAFTAGKNYDSWITWKTGSGNKNSLNAWATLSGNAASWSSTQKIIFGLVAPGATEKIEYKIKVPENTPPGSYTMVWSYGCDSLFEEVVCTIKYTKNITVKAGTSSPSSTPEREMIIIEDTDGDGIFDDVDDCPTVVGLPTNNGCPQTKFVEPPSPQVTEIREEVKPFFNAMFEGSCPSLHNAWKLVVGGSEIPLVCTGGTFYLPSNNLVSVKVADDWYVKVGEWGAKGLLKTVVSKSPAVGILLYVQELFDTAQAGPYGTRGTLETLKTISMWVEDGEGTLLNGIIEIKVSCPTGECEFFNVEKNGDKFLVKKIDSVLDATNFLNVLLDHNSVYLVAVYSGEESTPESSLDIKKVFTLPSYKQTSMKSLTGTIDDYIRGTSVIMTITNPDGTIVQEKLVASKVGYFSRTFQLTHETQTGIYKIKIENNNKIIDEYLFNIKEQTKSGVIEKQPSIISPPKPLVTTTVKEKVPGWIKNNAKWWAEGQIGETDFLNGIEYMVKEKIIDIPDLPRKASTTAKEGVPGWIKNTASWWGNDLITEDDFASGIKWLVENGIIRIN